KYNGQTTEYKLQKPSPNVPGSLDRRANIDPVDHGHRSHGAPGVECAGDQVPGRNGLLFLSLSLFLHLSLSLSFFILHSIFRLRQSRSGSVTSNSTFPTRLRVPTPRLFPSG